jgi:hypothetical protein
MKTSVKKPVIRTRPFKKNRFSWWKILAYIILPFYKLWLGLVWVYEFLFCETKWTEWNGVYGPGGTTYRYKEFSWGKLAFVISMIGLVLIVLFGLKII